MKTFTLITNYGNIRYSTMAELCDYLKQFGRPEHFPVAVEIYEEPADTRWGYSDVLPILLLIRI